MINHLLSRSRHFPQRLLKLPTLPARLLDTDAKDESLLKEDLHLPGIHLDRIDELIFEEALQPLDEFHPASDRNLSCIDEKKVFVIQPWNNYLINESKTDPHLQLQECISLANTIPKWSVIKSEIMTSRFLYTKEVLSKKQLEELGGTIQANPNISALFMGVEILSGIQLTYLEKTLGLPIYDRYNVVLNIFRNHARTREAKIQLALAELPYVKNHLREIHESSEFSSVSGPLKHLVGGDSEKLFHKRLAILKRREKKLLRLLAMLRKHQDVAKKARRKSEIPVISVVGYTNSGKTSLIKALTEDDEITPKDQLFATLDVTAHGGALTSNRKVVYLDTVGFISRIPVLLYDAFSATLRDILDSNLIVHVFDVSHPDIVNQHATVSKCLELLKVPKNLASSMITVANKIDLLQEDDDLPRELPKCDLKVSATNGTGLNDLSQRIEQQLTINLECVEYQLRVINTGPKYGWLRKNAIIRECKQESEESNYMLCTVSMSPSAIGRWKKFYGTKDIIVADYQEEDG